MYNKLELKPAQGQQRNKVQLEQGGNTQWIRISQKIYNSLTDSTNLVVYNSLVSFPCICSQSLQRYTSTFNMISVKRDSYIIHKTL